VTGPAGAASRPQAVTADATLNTSNRPKGFGIISKWDEPVVDSAILAQTRRGTLCEMSGVVDFRDCLPAVAQCPIAQQESVATKRQIPLSRRVMIAQAVAVSAPPGEILRFPGGQERIVH